MLTQSLVVHAGAVALLVSLAGCVANPLPDDLGDESTETTESDDEADATTSTGTAEDETTTDGETTDEETSATPDLPGESTEESTETGEPGFSACCFCMDGESLCELADAPAECGDMTWVEGCWFVGGSLDCPFECG